MEKDTEVSEEVVEHHVTTGGHMVYQRGFASSTCAVMLSGRLEIKAGIYIYIYTYTTTSPPYLSPDEGY